MKLNSGLGQLILKEEMERESRERSASRHDSPIHSVSHAPSSKTSSLPGYGKNGLHRPVSTDFAQYNSYGDVSGEYETIRRFQMATCPQCEWTEECPCPTCWSQRYFHMRCSW